MGKFCYGDSNKNSGAARISQSKAFCEGMGYRASDTVLSVPKTDNPYPDGSPDFVSWNLGWDKAETQAGGAITRALASCCATATVPA